MFRVSCRSLSLLKVSFREACKALAKLPKAQKRKRRGNLRGVLGRANVPAKPLSKVLSGCPRVVNGLRLGSPFSPPIVAPTQGAFRFA